MPREGGMLWGIFRMGEWLLGPDLRGILGAYRDERGRRTL